MSSADNNNSVLRAPPPFPGLLPRPPSSAPFHQQQHQSRGVYPASSSTATTPLTSSNRRTFQQQQPTTTGASALSSASPPGSPHTPTTTTTQQQINRHHQLIRWWRRVVILVLLTSCCSFALFPKMFAGVDKDSLLELEMSVVTTQRSESSSSSSSQPSHQAAHTRHHLPLKSLALQHRQLLDYELYTPPHEMLHRKATTADAAIRGDTSAAKLPQQQQQKQNGGGKKRAGHQQFPWRKVFIVANLYNNEDLIDDFTASLGAFIRRGILGMGLEGGGPSTPSSTSKQQTQRNNNKNNNNNGRGDDNADDGLYLKPEDVFVSVYSNANTDSTPYMLRDVLASELISISTDYNNQVPNRRQQQPSDISKNKNIINNNGGKLGFHVVPQGVPFCARQRHGVRASGYSYTEADSPTAAGGGDKYSSEAFDPGNERAGKPKDLSRIQWLACLRNTAMLPLYIRGVDGLFPSSSSGSVNDATSATSMGGDGSWINNMNAEYVEWKRKLTSATPPSSSAEGGVSSRRSIVDDGYDAFLEHLYTSTSEPGQQKRNVEEERQHKSNFMKTFIKGDTKGRWWEMMSSHTHYAHHPFNSAESTTSTSMNSTERQKNDEDEEDDDDVLVLFFNDIYFYPWQVSHLITPASTTAVSSTPSGVATNTNKQSANDVGDTVVEEGGHRVGDSGSESGGTVVSLDYGDRFDMTCAMDFYYNLYDTWVVRGVDGQPYSPYPPFARDHHSKALLRSVMGTNGVYNQVKNAAYFFEPDNEELEGISSTSTSSSSGTQIEGRDGQSSSFPGRYVDRGQRILESLLTTPSRSFGTPPASSARSSSTSTLTGLNLPTVPVRSCWNGVVAIRASMFTRYGLKFRYPTEEEKERCPDSECKYIGEDIIDIQSRNQLRRISNNIMRSHSDDATTPSSSLSKAAIVVHNKRGGGGGMRSLLRPASISINTLVQVSYEAGFFEMFQGEQVQNDVKIRIIPTGDDDDDQRNQNNGGGGGVEYVQWVSMSWYVPPQDPITMSDSRMANSLLHRLSDSRSGGSRHWISGSQIGAGRGGGLIWDWLLSSIHYHLPHTAAGDGIADTDKYDDDRNRNRRCLRSSSNQHHSIASLCISERASPPTLLAATWNTIHFLMSTPIRIVCFVLDWSIVPVLRVLWRILSILGSSYDDQWVPAVPSATSGERSMRPLSELLLATLSSSMNIAARLRHFYSSGFFFDFVSWLSVGEGGGGVGGEVFNTHKGSSSTITNIQQLPKYPLHPIIGANNNINNINADVRCPNNQKSLTPPLVVSISSSSSSSSSVISSVLIYNTACQLERQQPPQGYNDGGVGLDSVISLATSAAVLRHSQTAVKLTSSYSSDATIQAQLNEWKKDVIQVLRVNTAGSDRCGYTAAVVDDMMWKVVVDRLQPPINEAENAQKQQQRRQGKVDDSTTTTTSTSTTALKTLLLRACHRYLGISFNFGIWGRDEETERVAALHRNMIHQMVASRPQPSSTSSSSSTSHHLGSNTMGGININDDLRFMMPLDVFHTPRGSNHHDDWCSVVPCEFVRYQAMSSSSRPGPPSSSAICRSSNYNDGGSGAGSVVAPVTTFEEATTQLAVAGIRPRDMSPVIFALSSPSAMTCLWVTSTFNVKTSIASMSIWGLLVLFLAPMACATCLSITIRRMACTQRVCGDCGGGSDGCCVGVSASGTVLPSTPLSGCCGCVVPPEGMQRIWSVVRKGIVRKVCPTWVVGRNASLSPVSSSVPPYRSSSGDHTPYAVVIPNSTSPFDDVTAQDSSTTIRPVVVRNVNR